MREYFCFVTEPMVHSDEMFYFNWEYRQKEINTTTFHDNHSFICRDYGLDKNICNWYKYHYLTQELELCRKCSVDDHVLAAEWVKGIDYKKIVGPLDRCVYFTRSASKKFYIALRFLDLNNISYSVVNNPYPFDDSENYIVRFTVDQMDNYNLLVTLLHSLMYESSAIKYFVYGFDIFHFIRI